MPATSEPGAVALDRDTLIRIRDVELRNMYLADVITLTTWTRASIEINAKLRALSLEG